VLQQLERVRSKLPVVDGYLIQHGTDHPRSCRNAALNTIECLGPIIDSTPESSAGMRLRRDTGTPADRPG
jgi:hypothetical protein